MSNSKKPSVSVDFYDVDVFVTVREGDSVLTKPVALDALASIFGEVSLGSGLLPLNTLFWGKHRGKEHVGIYVPPDHYTLKWGKETFELPLPGFVFSGAGFRYRILATPERPGSPNEPLYHAPLPNVYGDGTVCRGSAPFPEASTDTVHDAFEVFVKSDFSSHLTQGSSKAYPKDLRSLWRELGEAHSYPIEDLVESDFTLRHVERGVGGVHV